MVGHAKERNRLYYLEIQRKLSISLLSEYQFFYKEKIWFCHHRLGHPSFRTLKILFHSLFKKLDVESFNCKVCELVKHKCSTFSIGNKRSLKPFHLIHSDIWSPSLVPNIFGVLLLSQIHLGHVGLCLSLMIILGSLVFFYLNTNLMWVLFSQISII